MKPGRFRAPLGAKSELTGAQPQNMGPEPLAEPELLRGVESFYRDCAQVQARFRNGEGPEIKRKLQMYNRVGLPHPVKGNRQVSYMLNNKIFVQNTNGVYSFDIKGDEVWHTLGAYVDKDTHYYQYFEPESGLYEFNDRAEFLAVLDSAFDSAGVKEAMDLPCIRYPMP